jgi:hypothetical protein
VVDSGSANDNLSMLAPFDGSVPGFLDISVRAVEAGYDGVAGVSYNKNETHLAHLPVRLSAEIADCLNAVASLEAFAARTVVPNCTSTAVSQLMESAMQGPEANAAKDGFLFGLRWDLTGTNPCAAAFVASIKQAGIPGPGGTFDVRLQEEGSAIFA